jgi:hypothetical protein
LCHQYYLIQCWNEGIPGSEGGKKSYFICFLNL